jgi:hypothetical protein
MRSLRHEFQAKKDERIYVHKATINNSVKDQEAECVRTHTLI